MIRDRADRFVPALHVNIIQDRKYAVSRAHAWRGFERVLAEYMQENIPVSGNGHIIYSCVEIWEMQPAFTDANVRRFLRSDQTHTSQSILWWICKVRVLVDQLQIMLDAGRISKEDVNGVMSDIGSVDLSNIRKNFSRGHPTMRPSRRRRR